MAHHLEHGPTDAEGINGSDANENKTHMADGTAGDPAFDVVLGKRIQRAVDDVHDAENHQRGRQGQMGIRQHLNIEAKQGIAPHFQKDTCQQHRHRCIRFTVCIRQPGVQGKHGEFDPEADQEAEITEQTKAAAVGAGGQFAEVECELIA